jgi:hypothetical protein
MPSHGWTAGWVGRRDRALLVLWQKAGLSFADIAALTVQDIRVEEGVATIRIGEGDPVTLAMTADCLLCAPCALVRWLHALDLSTLHSDGRVVASVIARAAPLTAHSPHVCEGSTIPTADTGTLPVFPPHDQWTCTLPAATQPAPAIRLRPPGPGGNRHGSGGPHGRTDHPPIESNPAPVGPSAALEARANALVCGLA